VGLAVTVAELAVAVAVSATAAIGIASPMPMVSAVKVLNSTRLANKRDDNFCG